MQASEAGFNLHIPTLFDRWTAEIGNDSFHIYGPIRVPLIFTGTHRWTE